MEQNNTYVLNPKYMVKPDRNRAIITNRNSAPDIDGFIGFVHPLYAILLSLFDGEAELSEIVLTASNLL